MDQKIQQKKIPQFADQNRDFWLLVLMLTKSGSTHQWKDVGLSEITDLLEVQPVSIPLPAEYRDPSTMVSNQSLKQRFALEVVN